MLWFAGLGISGPDGLGINTVKILNQADIVYLEIFTNPIAKSHVAKIKKLVKGQLKLAPRWLVEDGKEILRNAKKKKAVLLSYGDPYIATTHIELRTRASLEGIKIQTIHAASGLTSLIGECGLHYYKVGRPVTITKEIKPTTSAYYAIYHNLISGNHTLLPLEYDQNKNFFLDPKDAFANLISTEKGELRKVIDKSSYAIVASRVGSKTQQITAGKISSLQKIDFGEPPHTIIIPGKMHFTEVDALKTFVNCLDEPFDNSSKTSKISEQMIRKYTPMIRKVLKEIAPQFKEDKNLSLVLENAKHYVEDAEKFQSEGKDELAILAIGYADGLVDALRMSKGMNTNDSVYT